MHSHLWHKWFQTTDAIQCACVTHWPALTACAIDARLDVEEPHSPYEANIYTHYRLCYVRHPVVVYVHLFGRWHAGCSSVCRYTAVIRQRLFFVCFELWLWMKMLLDFVCYKLINYLYQAPMRAKDWTKSIIASFHRWQSDARSPSSSIIQIHSYIPFIVITIRILDDMMSWHVHMIEQSY